MEFEMNNKIQMHDINCLPLHSAVWEMSVKRLEGRDKTETIVNAAEKKKRNAQTVPSVEARAFSGAATSAERQANGRTPQ